MKRWVFDPALNCPRLMDDERSCDGSAFLVEGTSIQACRCVLTVLSPLLVIDSEFLIPDESYVVVCPCYGRPIR